MTHGSLARRYAGALFDVVQQTGSLEQARAELDGFVQLVAGHAELAKVLDSRAIPPARKHALVAALLDAVGGTSGEVRRLLLMLADNDRLGLVEEVARSFAERVMKVSRVLSAEVVTAVPLAESSKAALADALGRATGSRITMTERVDPGIVGGVVARVGSVVFDGSVTRQIERLRQRLLSQL